MGLGCRSGGYFVYMTIAVGILLIESFVWWLTHETTHTPNDPIARIGTGLERRLTRTNSFPQSGLTKRIYQVVRSSCTTLTFRDVMKNLVIRPCEIFNLGWLAYIILAQVFGAYQTCDCIASLWAGNGVRNHKPIYKYTIQKLTCSSSQLGIRRLRIVNLSPP